MKHSNKRRFPLQGMQAILEATKSEYEYLQKARESLHTRAGILITLLTALISAILSIQTPGLIELFQSNLLFAHLRILSLILLLFLFLMTLLSYVRIFFTKEYYLFTYQTFTDMPDEGIKQLNNGQLLMHMYRQYAKCIEHNQDVFSQTVRYYKTGNKWLIATIVISILSIIIISIF